MTTGPQPPAGPPPQRPQPPYGQPAYGQPPYGQAGHGQPAYGQAPSGPGAYGQMPQPPHPLAVPLPPPSPTGAWYAAPAAPPARKGPRLLVLGLVAVVVLALVAAGIGWSQGWFGTSAPRLKPAAGQTFPESFGDRNTRVPTTTDKPGSAFYKDSSGRTYTLGITETPLLLKDAASREKAEYTRTYSGDVYCFDVVKNPQMCHKQLAGGWLTFSSAQEWDGERIAGIMNDFYAQLKG